MEFGQVHHIEYYVNDLKNSNAFYDWFLPLLNYKKIADFGDGVSWEHKNGTYLVFVQVIDEYRKLENNRQGHGLNHIAFQGGSLTDLEKIERELQIRDSKVLKRDGKYLCFEDPNGFAIEIYAQ